MLVWPVFVFVVACFVDLQMVLQWCFTFIFPAKALQIGIGFVGVLIGLSNACFD
ncbi:MAG: hypothetical protein RIS47_2238 [Bacteroidota bacterium]